MRDVAALKKKIMAVLALAVLAGTAAYTLMKKQVTPVQSAQSKKNEWVILLHGIMRSPGSMDRIRLALEERGYRVVNFGYPSTRESLGDCADLLHEEVQKIPPGSKINIVTHSMGGIVVRYYLAGYPKTAVGRFVMIAPPNRGSSYARHLKRLPLFRWIFGRAGVDVAKDSRSPLADLPPLRCEFGIIAGGLGNGTGMNPLIPGDDDMTVGVEETKLEGMKDFIQIPGQHSLLLMQQRVIDNVIAFLDTGRFIH